MVKQDGRSAALHGERRCARGLMQLATQGRAFAVSLSRFMHTMSAASCTLVVVILVLIMGGCAPLGLTTSRPAYIEHNEAWTVVADVFGGVEMVQVPPGCFLMGNYHGRRDEQPVHEVCFDRPFWIDRYEVTNGQYGSEGAFSGPDHPRENLTWFEARDHCARRGARLPTEAEWEYAARGPDSLYYPWGDEFIEDNLVYDGNFNNQTSPVGSRPQGVSWVGAYDLSGNVWEWVSSLYRPYPYHAGDGREDPDDTTGHRVFRGGLGSYIDYGTSATTRFHAAPDARGWFIGFRCARDDAP